MEGTMNSAHEWAGRGPAEALRSDDMKNGTGLFYIAFFLMVLGMFLNVSNIETVGPVSAYQLHVMLRLGGILLLLIKLAFFQRMSAVKLVIITGVFLLGFLTAGVSDGTQFFLIVLFIMSGGDVNIKKLAGISLLVRVPTLLAAVLLSYAGMIENTIVYRGDTVRYSLGFSHPNTLGQYLVCICAAICILRHGKKPSWEPVIAIVCAYVSYAVADSRTSFMILIILAVFFVLSYLLKKWNRLWIAAVFTAFVAACSAAGSLLLMVIYDASNPLISFADSVFSGRFHLANMHYAAFGIRLLGYNYDNVSLVNGYYGCYVDNAYCQLVLEYGALALVVMLLIFVIFFAGGRDFCRRNQAQRDSCYCSMLGMCIYLIIGLAEQVFLAVEYNYFFIAVSQIFYGYKLQEYEKEKTPAGWAFYVLQGRKEPLSDGTYGKNPVTGNADAVGAGSMEFVHGNSENMNVYDLTWGEADDQNLSNRIESNRIESVSLCNYSGI